MRVRYFVQKGVKIWGNSVSCQRRRPNLEGLEVVVLHFIPLSTVTEKGGNGFPPTFPEEVLLSSELWKGKVTPGQGVVIVSSECTTRSAGNVELKASWEPTPTARCHPELLAPSPGKLAQSLRLMSCVLTLTLDRPHTLQAGIRWEWGKGVARNHLFCLLAS